MGCFLSTSLPFHSVNDLFNDTFSILDYCNYADNQMECPSTSECVEIVTSVRSPSQLPASS